MNKFKVGDKAKVIKEGSHCQKIGDIVEIVEIDEKNDRYKADCPYNGKWYFMEDELAPITYSKPTKQELLDMPAGTKIYTDAENENYQEWVKENFFYNRYGDWIGKCEINEDLTLDEDIDEDYGKKIIKIEVPTYETVYEYLEEEPKETLIEIIERALSDALGYAVKIVKEDK